MSCRRCYHLEGRSGCGNCRPATRAMTENEQLAWQLYAKEHQGTTKCWQDLPELTRELYLLAIVGGILQRAGAGPLIVEA